MKLKTINYLKETNQEFFLCRICQEIVSKDHFDCEEHIQKFNSVCDIEVKKSFENAFISINDNSLKQNMIIYSQIFILKRG